MDVEAASTLQDGAPGGGLVGWDEGSFEVNPVLVDRQPSLLGKNETLESDK